MSWTRLSLKRYEKVSYYSPIPGEAVWIYNLEERVQNRASTIITYYAYSFHQLLLVIARGWRPVEGPSVDVQHLPPIHQTYSHSAHSGIEVSTISRYCSLIPSPIAAIAGYPSPSISTSNRCLSPPWNQHLGNLAKITTISNPQLNIDRQQARYPTTGRTLFFFSSAFTINCNSPNWHH